MPGGTRGLPSSIGWIPVSLPALSVLGVCSSLLALVSPRLVGYLSAAEACASRGGIPQSRGNRASILIKIPTLRVVRTHTSQDGPWFERMAYSGEYLAPRATVTSLRYSHCGGKFLCHSCCCEGKKRCVLQIRGEPELLHASLTLAGLSRQLIGHRHTPVLLWLLCRP